MENRSEAISSLTCLGAIGPRKVNERIASAVMQPKIHMNNGHDLQVFIIWLLKAANNNKARDILLLNARYTFLNKLH